MMHVLCFGNLLHGDDAFGIHVHRRLMQLLDGRRVRLFEVGIRGMDALPLFEGCSRAVLVDALRDAALAPGTVCELDAAQLGSSGATHGAMQGATHGGGVGWLVRAVRATLDPAPALTLVGAVTNGIAPFGAGLTPLLASRVDEVAERVAKLVAADNSHG